MENVEPARRWKGLIETSAKQSFTRDQLSRNEQV